MLRESNTMLRESNTMLRESNTMLRESNTGYRFVAWNDADTTNPRTITVLSDTVFTAIFDIETGIADMEASTISVLSQPCNGSYKYYIAGACSLGTLYAQRHGRVLLRREIGNREKITINATAGIYNSIVANRQKHRGKLIIRN
jgi:hypothetical protein